MQTHRAYRSDVVQHLEEAERVNGSVVKRVFHGGDDVCNHQQRQVDLKVWGRVQ